MESIKKTFSLVLASFLNPQICLVTVDLRPHNSGAKLYPVLWIETEQVVLPLHGVYFGQWVDFQGLNFTIFDPESVNVLNIFNNVFKGDHEQWTFLYSAYDLEFSFEDHLMWEQN